MNEKERKCIDKNLCSRSLKYVRDILNNYYFAVQNNTTEELMKKHKKNIEDFEKYIQALRYDASGDQGKIWRLESELKLARKERDEAKKLYFELQNAKESEIEEKWEKIANTQINAEKRRINDEIRYGVELEMRDIKKELENQKKINEKWKAMFTEQAVANAKLINNGGE